MPADPHYFGQTPRYHVAELDGDFLELAKQWPALDHDYLQRFIRYGWAQDYASTPYLAVQRRPPSGLAEPPPCKITSPESAPSEFRRLLKNSLAEALGGANQVVVAMSGGLDSTALAVLCVELLGASNVHAVTTGYEWRSKDPEPEVARQVASHLGIKWTWVRADQDLIGWPPAPASWTGPQVSAPQSELTFAALVDRDVPVVAGYGGDPLMVGETGYYGRILRERGVLTSLQHLARGILTQPSAPGLGIRARLEGSHRSWQPGQEMAAAMFDPMWAELFESTYLAARHGRSPRWVYPFFDRRLFEFVAGLDMSPWRIRKHLIRVAFQDDLPGSVIRRPKSMAHVPPHLLPSEAAAEMRQHIEAASAQLSAFVDVESTLDEIQAGLHSWDGKVRLLRIAAVGQFLNHLGTKEGRS